MSMQHQKLKILHLEDLETDAELVERELRKGSINFEKIVVDDRESYIRALDSFAPDIILSDHSLPSFNSIEALKILHEKNIRIPFILITATVSEEFAVDVMKCGASDYILKDRLQRLPNAILSAMAKYEAEIDKELFLSQLKDSQTELRSLATHLQSIREEERADIAREIHDELGQLLTALHIDLSLIKMKLPKENEFAQDRITASIGLINTIIKTVRKIASQLRPPILDELGLSAALHWYSKEFENRTEIKCNFTNNSNADTLDKATSIGLFRVYQESLTNVARHAEATEVNSSLLFDDNCFVLTIKDNGKGFNMDEIKSKNRLGIVGMKERIKIMNGELTINSEITKGTSVSVKLEIEELPLQP